MRCYADVIEDEKLDIDETKTYCPITATTSTDVIQVVKPSYVCDQYAQAMKGRNSRGYTPPPSAMENGSDIIHGFLYGALLWTYLDRSMPNLRRISWDKRL